MREMLHKMVQWVFGIPAEAQAGVDAWSLRLAGMPHNLWLLMGLILAVGLLIWLTLRSYIREGQASRRAKLTLAALRVAVVCIVALLTLQPTAALRYSRPLAGDVVVLIDDSLSMRWADRYADAAERQALAAYLGVTDDQLDGPQRLTRSEIVKQAIGLQARQLAQVATDQRVVAYRFSSSGDRSSYIAPITLDAEGMKRLETRGFETNLGRAVREALDRLEGRRIAAVVVVSDGQNTAASAANRLAAARDLLTERKIPVWSVAVGDPTPPRNILVAQLQGPGEVRKNSTASFTVLLTHRFYGGTQVSVELQRAPVGRDDWETVASADGVTLATGEDGDEASGMQEVVLRAEATEVGQFTYRAVVPPRPDEMLVTDNQATTTVRVSDEKVAVLLVAGDAGWEYQFLRNYLIKHPEHYKVSTWQQNADAAFNQEASTGMRLTALPMSREELFKYDVIILYDPRYVPGSLDGQMIGLLDEFVGRHHGGLCYIVGHKFTDTNLMGGGPFDAVNKLLPVVLGRATGGLSAQLRAARTAYVPEVTAEGADHPLLQLADTPDENRRLLGSLPGVYRSHAVTRLKTLASSLLVSGDPSRQTYDGQREPLIAIQYYGKGRVLYHGFDTTWRWRAVDDTKLYQKYWANALDILAAGRLQKKRSLITPGGQTFDAGTEIRVRVEAYNRDYTPMEGKTFTVAVASVDGQSAVDCVLQGVRGGFYEGTFLADRTGTFEIRPKGSTTGQADWLEEDVATRRIEVILPEEEFRRPEADFQTLRQLCGDESRFLRVHELDQLPNRLAATRQMQVTESLYPVWNSWASLAVLGSLLLTEWTLRKMRHMV